MIWNQVYWVLAQGGCEFMTLTSWPDVLSVVVLG